MLALKVKGVPLDIAPIPEFGGWAGQPVGSWNTMFRVPASYPLGSVNVGVAVPPVSCTVNAAPAAPQLNRISPPVPATTEVGEAVNGLAADVPQLAVRNEAEGAGVTVMPGK